ncbi:unnamed protein product [Schistosoma mattheei]|uniref:Uncharacterized protein n=1 Tax=Schistosoma mattheei TaxID=31246 RepID=A0A183PS81_9TREM|nr:unnamed protein product [Schistosoma mattheei]
MEFMESGETCDIIAIEIAEQNIYFDRLLKSSYWLELGTRDDFRKFRKIWYTLDFKKLSVNHIRPILQENTSNCKHVKNVFQAVIQWISEDSETLIKFSLELLLCIRLGMQSST